MLSVPASLRIREKSANNFSFEAQETLQNSDKTPQKHSDHKIINNDGSYHQKIKPSSETTKGMSSHNKYQKKRRISTF